MHPMLVEMIVNERSAELARASRVPRPSRRGRPGRFHVLAAIRHHRARGDEAGTDCAPLAGRGLPPRTLLAGKTR
jgi:hypothetical protein